VLSLFQNLAGFELNSWKNRPRPGFFTRACSHYPEPMNKVIVAKRVDEQLQSKQLLGLHGGYCLETAVPHCFIQVIGKKI
jgi:hypothetical protein